MSTPFSLPYWLAAHHLPNVGPRTLMRWLEHFPDIETLFRASTDDWIAAGIAQKHIPHLQQPDWKAVEQALTWSQTDHHAIITLDDAAYPPLLKEISDPPIVLYLRGNPQALSHVQLALVGSRHATSYGIKNAESFAHHLAEAGFAITSGLALGIDGASHRGALSAKGITIGVAGTGLHHTYPAAHRTLVEDIIQYHGAVISEFPLPLPAHPSNFPRRNRIIGGLSIGVLVVEAALKSGSLITARLALEQGREVFAIPGSIHQPLARGCHHLIKEGAKLVESAADILEELGALQAVAAPVAKSSSLDGLPLDHQQLYDHIGHEITSLDVIILRTGLTVSTVSSMLLTLELHGVIQSVPGGYVRSETNQ
ncbi:MAG: DNA-protecting protein DprA [Gammaproteobacteria bacterium]|nr:MAG: DNA-protecting protein DprA [Gammaproteobacteria bacterium]